MDVGLSKRILWLRDCGRIVLDQGGIQMLRGVKGLVVPVAVVGPVLTGKSAFINRLIGREVFATGNTTMPCTKGVYLYAEDVSQKGIPVTRLYFDVQGFDDSFGDGNEELDILLFSLLISISKIVMYNSTGALDSRVFERIGSPFSIVPDKLLQKPAFAFVQRDFSLKVATKNNEILSQQEYLEHCIKHYKDKSTIKKINAMFTHQNQNLQCFLLPNPETEIKFNNKIKAVKQYIERITQLTINMQESENQLNVVNFLFNLTTAVDLINSQASLKQIYVQAKKHKEDECKVLLTTFKATFQEQVNEKVFKNLPLPEELLAFQIKNIAKQCEEGLGNYNKKEGNFVRQIMGDKSTEFVSKICSKVTAENKAKIGEFIVNKVGEFTQSSSDWENPVYDKKAEEIVEKLKNYYPFITESHTDTINKLFYKRITQELVKKYKAISASSQSQRKAEKSTIKIYQTQISELNQTIKQKTAVIDEQYKLISEKERRIIEMEETLRKRNHRESDIRPTINDIESYHDLIISQIKKEQTVLKDIQNQLRSNLLYDKKEKDPTHCSQESANTTNKIILSSINKVVDIIERNWENSKNQERKQAEKVMHLENLNKKLRDRLEQMGEISCSKVIENKYEECLNQLREKQRMIFSVAHQKETIIEKLNIELRHKSDLVTSLSYDLELLKSKITDRSKTSEFFEKQLLGKEKMIEQMRIDLLENLTRWKEEVNTVKNEARKREMEISGTLSMFVIQNEQLVLKNSDLNTKLIDIQSKFKKEKQEALYERDRQIQRLTQTLREFDINLSNATDSYTQITTNMEKIIKEKQDENYQLGIKIQQLENSLLLSGKSFENLQQRYEEVQRKLQKIEIQNEEIESKLSREEILSKNRIKHLEQQNDKIKSEMREKDSTFEIMLLQLRTNNIVSNSTGHTKSVMREESRQKYLKRIDEIEEKTTKELQEIENLNYTRRDGSSHKKPNHTRSQFIVYDENNEKRKVESYSDKKIGRLSFNGQFSAAKNLSNTSISSSFNGFKTLARRI